MGIILALISVFLLISSSAIYAKETDVSDPRVDLITSSSNSFGIDLYGELRKDNKNILFSPYSIYVALTMVAEGARHETAVEMGDVLHYPEFLIRDNKTAREEMTLIHSALSGINKKFEFKSENKIRKEIEELERAYLDSIVTTFDTANNEDTIRVYNEGMTRAKRASDRLKDARAQLPHYELRIANGVWVEQTFNIIDEYRNAIEKYYLGGGVFSADFKKQWEKERVRIDQWIEGRTKGRIQNVVPQLNKLVRIVLVNAIYFMGGWQQTFEGEETKLREFLLDAGRTVKTPTMKTTMRKSARYAAFNADGSLFSTPESIRSGQSKGLYPDADGFAVLEMPYKECDLSMVIVAPNSPGGLAAIEMGLSPDNISRWIKGLRQRAVHVILPKFTSESTYPLKRELKNLGMKLVFDSVKADLSGICRISKNENLSVSEAVQKSFLRVNEKGTEAAAATVVSISVSSTMRADEKIPFIPTFKADRPFLFIIHDGKSGLILFMGRVVDPNE